MFFAQASGYGVRSLTYVSLLAVSWMCNKTLSYIERRWDLGVVRYMFGGGPNAKPRRDHLPCAGERR